MIKKILLTPFQKFVKTESLAGMLLFGATIIALFWANSIYGEYYEILLQHEIGISFQSFELKTYCLNSISFTLLKIFTIPS